MLNMKKRLILTHHIPLEIDTEMREMFDIEIVEFNELMRREVIDAHGLITILSDDLSAAHLDKFSCLEVIAQYAVGTNNIDLDECKKREITVCHTPDVLTQATADLAFALLLSLARKIPEAQKFAQQGKWSGWNANHFLGKSLEGAKLGIIGLGSIGSCFARMCQQIYQMDIVYYNGRPSKFAPSLNAVECDLEQLCQQSDIISLHAPLNHSTKNLLHKKHFDLMKTDALLINTARGEIIDQDALTETLKQGKLLGVGLDVTTPEPLPKEHELYRFPRVLVTPHIGSAQKETRENMAWLCWRNAQEVLEGRAPITAVALS